MYEKTAPEIWQGRIDHLDGSHGLRWHQVIKRIDLSKIDHIADNQENKICFLGFCSDEGVARNQGRIGAKEGPDHIRKAMASFPVHFTSDTALYDAGNIICADHNLEAAQQELAEAVHSLLSHGYKPVVLGGGHEIAYGHYLGIHQFLKNSKKGVGIINFDAHFDIRTYEEKTSSGTPFLQIADLCKSQQKDFEYFVLGIQEQANTQALFRKAKDLRVKYLKAEEVHIHNTLKVEPLLQDFIAKSDHLYVTLCLDVFAAAFAPGVSAANPSGIHPDIAIHLLKQIASSGKVISLDIAEYAPKYDIQQHTAKLAAHLVYHYIQSITSSNIYVSF